MNAQNMKGFTLIELMIVVAVIGIISAIAYPSYQASVTKTKRADAKTSLMNIATQFERCFTVNGQYNYTAGPPVKDCATPGGPLNATLNTLATTTSDKGYYTIALSSLAATTFLLTATPVATDAKCTTFTLDQTGARNHTGSGTSLDCW